MGETTIRLCDRSALIIGSRAYLFNISDACAAHNSIHRSRVNFRTSFSAVSCWTFLDFFGKSNKFSKGSKQRRIL